MVAVEAKNNANGLPIRVRAAIVAALAIAVVAATLAKEGKKPDAAPIVIRDHQNATTAKSLPKLLDLGGAKCIPCKMMAPILEELMSEYAGRLEVELINAKNDPATQERYKIKIIPTQIFFNASGNELFRHEGFLSKKDIVDKWRELGIDLSVEPSGGQPRSSSEHVGAILPEGE